MLAHQTPFPDLLQALPGVTVRDRTELGLAIVSVRNGLSAALSRRVREHFGLELPMRSRRASAGPIAWAGTGPDHWLASCEGGHKTFAATLSAVIGDVAAVSDQSDGHAVLRLCGDGVPVILSKLVPIDLDPSIFEPEHIATTIAAHITLMVWRLEDRDGSQPSFEVAVPRSLARSFSHALLTSAGGT